jgi:hypothetical protein
MQASLLRILGRITKIAIVEHGALIGPVLLRAGFAERQSTQSCDPIRRLGACACISHSRL